MPSQNQPGRCLRSCRFPGRHSIPSREQSEARRPAHPLHASVILLAWLLGVMVLAGLTGCAQDVNVMNLPLVVTTPHTSYSNTIGGSLCGTSTQNQCEVPAGKQLVIEHVSGYIFKTAPTAFQNTGTSMAVTDPALGLNGNGFHVFLATKINDPASGITDVFVFSLPFKMLLSPGAKYYFSDVAGISVSGYLEDAP